VSEKGDRPIPVRSVAPPPAPVPAPPSETPAADQAGSDPPLSQPPRLLEIDGRRWEVHAVGRTRTGHGRDAGALLLLLTFTPVEVGDATPAAVREALAVARSLEDLDDEVLAELLERSRPVPGRGTGTQGS